jgi:peptidoglycan glycosyltransferase
VNTPLRKLATVAMLMCLALMASSTWIQFFQAERLNDNPLNIRTLYRDMGGPRGQIVAADGTVMALSVPSADKSDPYKYQRQYTDPYLYSSVTGYFGWNGSSGLEEMENDFLSGQADDLALARLGDTLIGRTPTGADVVTTIVPEVQRAAVEALGDQQGAIVVIEPSTGKILALVSTPGFDPNLLANHDPGTNQKEFEALLAAPGNPLLNKAYRDFYPPGSTFKVITAAAALESGGYTERSMLPSPQKLEFREAPGYPLHNFGDNTCSSDPSSLADSMRVSCNTSFGWLGMELGADALREQAEEFGFGIEVRIPMPAVASRFTSRAEGLDQPQTARSAIGQEDVAATPLQIAMVSAAIANDGVLMNPYLVQQRVRSSDASVISTTKPTVLNGSVVSPSTAQALTNMMELVVQRGSATAAQIPGVAVAAKTGTAETFDENGVSLAPHVWFTGFAPADDPQVAVVVFIKHGGDMGNNATGGKTAAPVAKKVIEAVLNL